MSDLSIPEHPKIKLSNGETYPLCFDIGTLIRIRDIHRIDLVAAATAGQGALQRFLVSADIVKVALEALKDSDGNFPEGVTAKSITTLPLYRLGPIIKQVSAAISQSLIDPEAPPPENPPPAP